MTIAYYITAHGFGHFVRSAAVIKALPAEIPLIVRTNVPAWFLEHELRGSNYVSHPAAFDCGTLGRDSASVDAAMTFERAAQMQKENETRFESEAVFLRSHGVRLVVTDMAPFPLRVASKLGIPSICVTNFTWVEIYEGLIAQLRLKRDEELASRGEKIVSALKADYALGDLLLIPGMALKMGACRRQIEVPVIARTGKPRRELLCERLSLDPDLPIYLLYLGQEGYEGMKWENLEKIPRAQFFSFRPVGEKKDFVRVLPTGLMDHSDATATADAVVGKLGYSLCAECSATRKPLIFPPRPDFVEAEALSRAMIGFGLGIPLLAEDFQNLKWRDALARSKELSVRAQPIDCSGAQICAEIIGMAWREGTLQNILAKT